jgi:hypothetical protein
MRKNTQQVFQSWFAGKSNRLHNSISTDGTTIFSYSTPIVIRKNENKVEFNLQKYSVTTTRQQNSLRILLDQNKIEITS